MRYLHVRIDSPTTTNLSLFAHILILVERVLQDFLLADATGLQGRFEQYVRRANRKPKASVACERGNFGRFAFCIFNSDLELLRFLQNPPPPRRLEPYHARVRTQTRDAKQQSKHHTLNESVRVRVNRYTRTRTQTDARSAAFHFNGKKVPKPQRNGVVRGDGAGADARLPTRTGAHGDGGRPRGAAVVVRPDARHRARSVPRRRRARQARVEECWMR